MLIKTKAIVLSAIKYQEKKKFNCKMLYPQSWGKIIFCSIGFSTKKTSQRVAYFQPLTLLEIEATHKNKGTLEHFKEVKLAHPYQTIPLDIIKVQ